MLSLFDIHFIYSTHILLSLFDIYFTYLTLILLSLFDFNFRENRNLCFFKKHLLRAR